MSADVFKGTTTLVTGASSGIGKALAHSLARRGANLIITARSEGRLNLLANELREKYKSDICVIPLDLTAPDAPQQIFEKIKENQRSVDLLLNNAGFGKWTDFHYESLETYERMLSLNINALVKLTYLCLPEMLKSKSGGVINVSSTAAFQPIPYQAVYAASKAFVLSFTEALAGEYKEDGVRFMALCPGNTETNFMTTANANAEGMPFDTPEVVAENGLKAFEKGKNCYVQGRTNYINSLLPRVLPRDAVIRIVAGMFRNRVAPQR